MKVRNIVFIALGVMLAACSSETPKEDIITDTIASDSARSDESQGASYSLPSPLKIASIFKKSGMKYKSGVTSQLKDPSKYITTLSKALNLGVYSADLSYCVLNKQTQDVISYMQLSREMGEKLGMGAVYEKNNFIRRFEKNIGNEDSLAQIISELKKTTDIYLEENNQKQVTTVVFAGAWIESLYIASKISETGDQQNFNRIFSGQMKILGSIIDALKVEEKKDPNISPLTAELENIKNMYETSNSVKNIDESSSNEPILTHEEIAPLTKEIEKLRTKFING